MDMAETEKGPSPSVNQNKRGSLLDLDLEKDFLGSWKSIAMPEDPMDLDFVAVPKGMKKAFNFDKVDMDFNIDTDYGKLPSFDMGISDLGISSPLKKDAKSRDRSNKELDSGTNKGKTGCFSFTFDFNELDGFNFKSSPQKEEIEGNKNEEKENSSRKIGTENSGNHPVEDDGDNGSHEDPICDVTPICEVTTPAALISPKLDTQVDAGSDLPALESFSSKSTQIDKIILNSKAKMDDVESSEVVALPEKTISSNKQQSDCIMDKPISPEPFLEESYVTTETVKEASVHCTSSNKFCRDNVMELQNIVSCADTGLIATSDKESKDQFWSGEDSKRASGESTSNEKGSLGQNISEASKNPSSRCEGTEYVLAEPVPDRTSNLMKQQNTLEVSTKPISSGLEQTMPAPVQSTSTAANTVGKQQREAFTTRSKYFKRPDKPEDVSSNASNQTKFFLLTNDVTGSRQPHLADESSKSNVKEIQSDGKLNDMSGAPVSEEHTGNEGHNKDLRMEGPDQGTLKGKPVSGEGSKNIRSLDSIRQTNKFALKNAVNSTNLAPNKLMSQSIKKSTPEGCKSYTSKAVMKMATLCRQKTSRTSRVNLDLAKLIPQKDTSSKDLDQNRILVESRQSETARIIETKKQTLLNPSLKRKMIEIPNADADLKPSKRFSEPTSNRNSTEVWKNVVVKETCINENVVDGNGRNILENSQNSDLDVHWELSMKELEPPFSLENDSNIEKAEACCKELDDICYMLRKKHDEAKELLVRAIVNNNILLMLNHPQYEEKKFASQLTLREVNSQT